MANLLRECPFSAFPHGTKLNQFGMRDKRMQQQPPKSTTICYDHNGRKRKCNIIMDDAQSGPEWPLQYLIPNFQQNCVDRFELEGKEQFAVFGRCVFGLGTTYWDEVLQEVAGRTDKDLNGALTF